MEAYPEVPDPRASDQDRDVALERLSHAAGDGRLALEEYSERADRALAARTLGELALLTRDLERVAEAGAAAPAQISTVLGSESRKGYWRVPERLELRSVLGDCTIELQDAVLSAPVATIDARTTLGSVTIVVPDGVDVRLFGRAVLGETSSELRDAPLPGAPVIEVHARAVLGKVEVRPPPVAPAQRARDTLAGRAAPKLERPRDER